MLFNTFWALCNASTVWWMVNKRHIPRATCFLNLKLGYPRQNTGESSFFPIKISICWWSVPLSHTQISNIKLVSYCWIYPRKSPEYVHHIISPYRSFWCRDTVIPGTPRRTQVVRPRPFTGQKRRPGRGTIPHVINGHATGTDSLEVPTIYCWPIF